MWREVWLLCAKDLRVEWRSRVATNQVVPFALLVLVLFAFALDANGDVLERATAGLFWVAVLFSAVLAIQRSFGIETIDGNRDALRLSGLRPASIFLGKAAAVAIQLLVVELVLLLGVAVLYDKALHTWWLLALSCLVATVGLACAGSLYGVLAAGLRASETLLPLLLLPILAPVLIAATRSFDAALDGFASDGWPWLGMLTTFALTYLLAGVAAFGALLEES